MGYDNQVQKDIIDMKKKNIIHEAHVESMINLW